MIDALKHFCVALAVLLAIYVPSIVLLTVYVRNPIWASAALACFLVYIVAVLLAARRIFRWRFLGLGSPSFHWALIVGALALIGVVCLTFVYGSIVSLRIRSITPAGIDPVNAAVYGVGIALMAAVSEGMAFRGVVQSWLARKMSASGAVLVTSVLFCAWHAGNPLFLKLIPFYILVGVVLGTVFSVSGALAAAIILHFALDTVLNLASSYAQPFRLNVTESGTGSLLVAAALGLISIAASWKWALPRLRSSAAAVDQSRAPTS